ATRSQAQGIPTLHTLPRWPGHRGEKWQLSAADDRCGRRTTEKARLMKATRLTKSMELACPLLALCAAPAFRQPPHLTQIPPYRKELDVTGGVSIAGSELKGVMDKLVEGFQKVQPNAKVSTNYMTSSEGALGMMYAGVSDIAPMGDDAKITDQMPFFN